MTSAANILPFHAEVLGGEPAPADAAPVQAPCKAVAPIVWERATDAQRTRARGRLAACARSDALARDGMPRADADAVAAHEADESVRSIGRWRRRIRDLPPGERLAALLDAPRAGRPRKEWAGPAERVLWDLWCADWLREEAPDATAVHRRIAAVAEARGWPLPSLDAFRRRTARELSHAEVVRARKGAIAAKDLHPHQTRTVAGIRPLEIVNGDGRRHDLQVRLPSGKVGRPVVWMWQDVRTRRILSWRAGETESADVVRTALHELITAHGVPERIVVDQTLAASTKWMTGGMPHRKRWRSTAEELPGLLALLEIAYSPTAVDRDAAGRGKGRGRSKPVERAFGDLARQIDTHPLLAGAYTGRSTQDRPETHRTAVADWDTFVTVLEACVAEHNARPGRRTEAAAGRSFDAVWTEEIAAATVRRLAPSQAAILLLAAEPVKVAPDGTIRLKCGRGASMPHNRYHAPALVDHAGREVVARFDPADLHGAIHVYDEAGRYLCEAPCLLPVGFADADRARSHERARRKVRQAAERSVAARRDFDALQDTLRELPPPEPPVEPEPAAVKLVVNDRLPAIPPPTRQPSERPERTAAAKGDQRGGLLASLRNVLEDR
ncbi:MAG: Mu transposase C-terminal domain-containing protein [Rhodospirillales bacterium]|nr:Mu transposase C-terminal domain-containing protein [Rhodospirillales bacterium]